MRLHFFALIFLISFFFCNRQPADVRIIDPDETSADNGQGDVQDGYEPLKVAVSAILSPRETFESYERIFDYISGQMGRPIEFHQRQTYGEVNQMLEKGQLDFAFICTGAYVSLDLQRGIELLAVPVSNGKPYYYAYIIAGADSQAQGLEDLENTSFAFTDPLSNTGYLYAVSRLREKGISPDDFFSSTVFSYAHDNSIQMVARGIVEAATVNQLIFDYVKVHEPRQVDNIKIVEVSPPFGNPPVVVSSRLDPEKKQKLKNLFLTMHEDPQTRDMLEVLLIDRFIEGKDSDYDPIREMSEALDN